MIYRGVKVFLSRGGSLRPCILSATNSASKGFFSPRVCDAQYQRQSSWLFSSASTAEEEYNEDIEENNEVRHVERGILFSAPCLDHRTQERFDSIMSDDAVESDCEHVEGEEDSRIESFFKRPLNNNSTKDDKNAEDDCPAMNSDKEPGLLFSVPRVPPQDKEEEK